MALALDTVTNGEQAAGGTNATLAVAHTCTGSNMILIAAVAFNDSNQHNNQTASVDYNGSAMTLLAKADSGAAKDTRAELWYLLNPTTGSSLNVNVHYSNINYVGAGVLSFTGVKQSAPTISTTTTGTTSSASKAITTVDDNSWIIDCLSCETQASVSNTGSPTQTSKWQNTNQSFQWGQGSIKGPITPAGSATLGWSSTTGNTWSYVQMAISPLVAADDPAESMALTGVG